MSVINQISKDGAVYDISAIYDDLENKISEFYAAKSELTALQASVQQNLAEINEKIAVLEGYHKLDA